MKVSDFNIGARLWAGFGVLMLLCLALGADTIWNALAYKQQLSELAAKNTAGAVQLGNARNAMWQLRYGISQFIAVPDPAARAKIVADTSKWHDQITANLKQFSQVQRPEEQERTLAALQESYRKYAAARPKWLELYGQGKIDEAKAWREQTILPFGKEAVDALGKLIDLQQQDIQKTEAAALSAIDATIRTTVLPMLGLVLLTGSACAYFFVRSIVQPLREAIQVARTVSSGDLSGHITTAGRDETGQLLNAMDDMNSNLRGIVGQVRSGADSIASASIEIASASRDMSSRTEQQAGTLEETAASIEELSTTVQQSGNHARQANQLAQSASAVAVKGGQVVEQVVGTMGAINDSAQKISDIIGVIDGIAFQTNILALNAAVEAARAGEQGRGFAVVAAEVRNLAQRSAGAAKEIKVLINDSVDKVSQGSKLVAEAGSTMNDIVTSIQRVTSIMGELNAASHQQEDGIAQIHAAIVALDGATQQNAAMVEQAAATASALEQQAAALSQAVSLFRLDHRSAPAAALALRHDSGPSPAHVPAGVYRLRNGVRTG